MNGSFGNDILWYLDTVMLIWICVVVLFAGLER